MQFIRRLAIVVWILVAPGLMSHVYTYQWRTIYTAQRCIPRPDWSVYDECASDAQFISMVSCWLFACAFAAFVWWALAPKENKDA